VELVLGAFTKRCFKQSDGILNRDVCGACLQHLKDYLRFLQ